MARAHYFYYLINSAGEPIPDAEISIYSAGTTTAAKVFFSESGGTSVSTAPQTTTDDNGFFEFWIADSMEGDDGYTASSKFDISWSSDGVAVDGTLSYIDFITPRAITVSTTSIPTTGWTADDGQYYYDVVHGLNNEYPLIVLYETSTGNSVPTTAGSVSANTTRVWKIDDAASVVSILG